MWAYFALAAMQALGGYQQAQLIRQNGDLQASIAGMNAQFAMVDAHNALEAGYTDADRYADVINSTQANDKAALAGSNQTIGYGTAGDIEKDNTLAGMENTMQIQTQARNQAMGYENQAINISLGGQMTSLQSTLNAGAAQNAGVMSAIGTAISGYDRYNSTGKGLTSKSGTDSAPNMRQASNVNVNSSGDGVYSGTQYSNGWGWYPRGAGDYPGFFGKGPTESYGNPNNFVDEVG